MGRLDPAAHNSTTPQAGLLLRPYVMLSAAAFASIAPMRIADPLMPQVAREFGATVGVGAEPRQFNGVLSKHVETIRISSLRMGLQFVQEKSTYSPSFCGNFTVQVVPFDLSYTVAQTRRKVRGCEHEFLNCRVLDFPSVYLSSHVQLSHSVPL